MPRCVRIFLLFLSVSLLPAAIASCSRVQDPVSTSQTAQRHSLQLALSMGGIQGTKADVSTLTEMASTPVFRGMENLRLVPFAQTVAVNEDSRTLSYALGLPAISGTRADVAYSSSSNTYHSGLVNANHAHLYSSADAVLPLKTSRVLIYGQAATASAATPVESKHLNGSLLPQGLSGELSSAGGVTFYPETMISGRPEAALTIASALDAVVLGNPYTITAFYGNDQSTTVSMAWDENIGDANLRESYISLTSEGSLMSASGANVEALLTSLYRVLVNYTILNSVPYEIEKGGDVYEARKADNSILTYGDMYRGVLNLVLDRIRNCDLLSVSEEDKTVRFANAALSAYPESLGLPSGAAVVRFTPTGYVVPLEAGLDGIAPISRYCYPPSLYYFADSAIKTADSESVRDVYTKDNAWGDILTCYTNGGTVSGNTRSAVLVEPMQFAVGMLSATVRAASATLQDNDDLDYTVVTVTENAFPLTGIIIGGQYPQRFDFTPIYTSESATPQYYLYDNQFSGVYLNTQTSAAFRTLVLQSPPEKNIFFTLEFQNNSSQTFYGVEGRILPGHKFYLVGKLEVPPEYDQNGDPRPFDSVFLQDRITTVNCVVTSFKNAHNAIPDLGIPQLNLGVQAVVNWTLSTPTTLMLE